MVLVVVQTDGAKNKLETISFQPQQKWPKFRHRLPINKGGAARRPKGAVLHPAYKHTQARRNCPSSCSTVSGMDGDDSKTMEIRCLLTSN